MAKRKPATEGEETAVQAPEDFPPATEPAAAAEPQAATGPAPAPAYAPVQAPAKGPGDSYTIDHRLGYRKEDIDTPNGKRRQIRFAQKPDDEVLAAVREQKPAVKWASREQGWQARKNQDGLEALDTADQKLNEIGRKRSTHER